MKRTPSPLHLVEPDFDAQLRAERDRLSARYDRRPIDLYDSFAEQHQVDPDEATRDALYAEISDALIWLGLGALAGSFATVLSAWIIAQVAL